MKMRQVDWEKFEDQQYSNFEKMQNRKYREEYSDEPQRDKKRQKKTRRVEHQSIRTMHLA